MPGTAIPALMHLTLALGALHTIATGVISVNEKETAITIGTEAAASSDNLDAIQGGAPGQFLLVSPSVDGKAVVLVHGSTAEGQLLCPGSEDITLTALTDYALLFYTESGWAVLAFSTLTAAYQPSSAVLSALALGSADHEVVGVVACANATGGATTALLTVDLFRRDGTTRVASARQVLLQIGTVQYLDAAGPSNASLSLGTVTAGSIAATIVAGSLYLIETDATGNFDCTVTNTDDETVYLNVKSAGGGVSSGSKACVVTGSNSDSATWSA